MGEQFRREVEARVESEFGCPERDAERVAEAVARACAADGPLDWSLPFVVAKMTDAPRDASVPQKWNWVLDYRGGDADLDEYRVEE